jgi:beta-N-acetylhexosaminidase
MLDLAGLEMTPAEREMLQHPQVGGVILFSRNYESPQQIAALIEGIHALRQPKLLVAVDHEGGRVQRFRDGFTRLPPAAAIGGIYRQDRARGRHVARELGWLMAAELRAVGVDFSFAPVLDLGRGVSGVIGDRAFHRHPDAVADIAHHYMMGMHDAGMPATGKHFPGHGSVKEDSHLTLPVDDRRLEDILIEDALPFERMSHYGLAAVMMAHVVYSHVDSSPAGFSGFWIRHVLRERIGFQGVVFSDDLSMAGAAVAGGYDDRARAALEAGSDMVLICNHPEGAAEALQGLQGYDDPVAHMRLARMHGRHPVTPGELCASRRWREAVVLANGLDDSVEMDLNL